MSRVELVEAQGSAWSYLLVVVLFFALPVASCWFALYGGQHLLTVLRRGHAYRARLRAARHRRPYTVRSTR